MAPTEMLGRGMSGIVCAAGIAALAYRAKSLDRSGAVAATAVGGAAAAAGWRWGALLVLYFIVSSLLSHFRRDDRERRTAGVIEKGGARDATQVLANGGIFATSAVLASFGPPLFRTAMTCAALGALAASAADTWATEIGTLAGGTPRSLRGFERVQPGTSGAVSLAGTLAMIAGAACVALVARWLGVTHRVLLVTLAGIAGAVADSVIGATAQARRWCDTCGSSSEKEAHDCGAATRIVGGRGWIDNDLVNLLATFVGAAVAAGLSSL